MENKGNSFHKAVVLALHCTCYCSREQMGSTLSLKGIFKIYHWTIIVYKLNVVISAVFPTSWVRGLCFPSASSQQLDHMSPTFRICLCLLGPILI